jgi:hypothetical protein
MAHIFVKAAILLAVAGYSTACCQPVGRALLSSATLQGDPIGSGPLNGTLFDPPSGSDKKNINGTIVVSTVSNGPVGVTSIPQPLFLMGR